MAVLDSSFLIDIMRAVPEAVALLEELEQKEHALFIPSPAIMELWNGAVQSQIPEQETRKIERLLEQLPLVLLDADAAKRAGEIHAFFSKSRIEISTVDLMIGGIALAHGETVVTRDSDYTRIPGLKVLKY